VGNGFAASIPTEILEKVRKIGNPNMIKDSVSHINNIMEME